MAPRSNRPGRAHWSSQRSPSSVGAHAGFGAGEQCSVTIGQFPLTSFWKTSVQRTVALLAGMVLLLISQVPLITKMSGDRTWILRSTCFAWSSFAVTISVLALVEFRAIPGKSWHDEIESFYRGSVERLDLRGIHRLPDSTVASATLAASASLVASCPVAGGLDRLRLVASGCGGRDEDHGEGDDSWFHGHAPERFERTQTGATRSGYTHSFRSRKEPSPASQKRPRRDRAAEPKSDQLATYGVAAAGAAAVPLPVRPITPSITSSYSMMAMAVASAPAAPIWRLPATAVSCGPIVGIGASAVADDRQRDHERSEQDHSVPRHRKPGDEPEHDEHQSHVHHAEDNKPGNYSENNVKSAGKPADLLHHKSPPMFVPLGDLAPPLWRNGYRLTLIALVSCTE